MLKFNRLGEGTPDCGKKVINTFELYSDVDHKINYSTRPIKTIFCKDGRCGCLILTSHLDI